MKWYNNPVLWLVAVVYASAILVVVAMEPIEDLRVPLEYYEDGTLKSELFARRARVEPDGKLEASGVVFRLYGTNGTVDVEINAESARWDRAQQVGRSDKAVSLKRGDFMMTGKGFEWNGADGVLSVRQDVRVSFASEMIKKERVLNHDKQNP